MLKYIAVTLVALVGIGLTIGDESRRQEVARASSDPLLALNFAGFSDAGNVEVETLEAPVSGLSDGDAVATALEAAKMHRATQEVRVTLRGTTPAAAPAQTFQTETSLQTASVSVDDVAAPAQTWFVTGSRVNIRSGPSTSDGVVKQALYGDEATALSDTSRDWIEIQFADGQTGWIFSKFLSDSAPG